jgi:DNA-binding transcriptional LysR family regulator
VGFRIGLSPAKGVIARKLFPLQLIICAAPEYLARHGAPKTLQGLIAHRCSAYRSPGTGRAVPWYAKVGDGIVEQQVRPALCVNDEALEAEAVLGGHVIGQLTAVTVASHIRSGRLVPLLTEHVADQSSVFVYYGSRAAQPVRMRAFVDLAVKRLAGNADFVLSAEELAAAEAKGRKAIQQRD